MNYYPLKVLYRPGKLLQAKELIETQEIASSIIAHPFKFLLGSYRVIAGLRVTVVDYRGLKVLRLSPGKLAAATERGWFVLRVPSYEVVHQDYTYIGLRIEFETSYLPPDPALGGPILGKQGDPLLKVYAIPSTRKGEGFPIAEVLGDKVYHYQEYLPSESQEFYLSKELRRRVYEEFGDFIAKGLEVSILPPSTVTVSPGIAYIKGRRVNSPKQYATPLLGPIVYITDSGRIECPPEGMVSVPPLQKVITREGQPVLHRNRMALLLRSASIGFIPTETSRLAISKVLPDLTPLNRLPTNKDLEALYRTLLLKLNPQQQTEDTFHPLYTASVSSGIISLGYFHTDINVPLFTPPFSEERFGWQTAVAETVEMPATLSPLLILDGSNLKAYNLPPNPQFLTCSGINQTPVSLEAGSLSSEGFLPNAYGFLSLTLPFDCEDLSLGPYKLSTNPTLDRGFAQRFYSEKAIQVSAISFYAATPFSGVCVLSSSGRVLSYTAVSDSLETGWVKYPFKEQVTVLGSFEVTLLSSHKPLIGTFIEGVGVESSESITSKGMLLSTSGQWLSITGRDLCCEIFEARGLPNASYDFSYEVKHLEAFDSLTPDLSFSTPNGSKIFTQWYANDAPINNLSSIQPTTSITLKVKAFIGSTGGIPTFKGGKVTVRIARKESTWVGKNEELGIYSKANVYIKAKLPEGTSIKVFLSGDKGRTWAGMELKEDVVLADLHYMEYSLSDLPPYTVSQDVSGNPYNLPRESARLRIDLSTQLANIRPEVIDIRSVYL